jgi:hypothetical protein
MVKEPEQENAHAQEKELVDTDWKSPVADFGNFLLDNYTVVISLSYAYLTATGMSFSYFLYGKFGINIFDYAEIADFLLAAFKNPISFVSAGFTLVLGLVFRIYDEVATARRAKEEDQAQNDGSSSQDSKEYQRAKEEAADRDSKRRREISFAIGFAFSLITATVMPPYLSATRTALSIKGGKEPTVDVRYRSFSGSAGQVTKPGLELIGTTQRVAFFYDVDEKRTIVIPQAQIVSIEVPE